MEFFFLGNAGVTIDISVTLEFNEGRTQSLFICNQNFARRKTCYIIYPSKMIPKYSDTLNAFQDVSNLAICAPVSFNFYTKQTTTNRNECPMSQYAEKNIIYRSYNYRKKCFDVVIASLSVILLTKEG